MPVTGPNACARFYSWPVLACEEGGVPFVSPCAVFRIGGVSCDALLQALTYVYARASRSSVTGLGRLTTIFSV